MPRIRKFFDITRTVYLKSERSEHFLKQNTTLTCYWRFLQIEYIGTIKVPIGTNTWDVETYRNKLEKVQKIIP